MKLNQTDNYTSSIKIYYDELKELKPLTRTKEMSLLKRAKKRKQEMSR